jgi:hypothetical protein
MKEEKKLYVPWDEKLKELAEELGSEDDAKGYDNAFRSKSWDRTEDQIFIFIMTVALM